MAVLNYGLGSTRYGVRLGSMANSDAANTAAPFAQGQNPNWGQGINPYVDNPRASANPLSGWTAMPYLRPCGPFVFDGTLIGTGTYGTVKMIVPQDILLPRTQAVDTSMQSPHAAFYGLGAYGAVGSSIGPNRYGVTLTSYMADVSAECMLGAIDINEYRKTLIALSESSGSVIAPLFSPSNTTGSAPFYSPIPMYGSGPWITASDMFSNPAIYCYLGQRDDSDTILGVQAWVNCALAKISYGFSINAGLTRSIDLMSPWSVMFSRAAIKAWYAVNTRYRLVTPGLRITNTLWSSSGSGQDYKYNTGNAGAGGTPPAFLGALPTGGEFMGLYSTNQWTSTASNYFTSASDAGTAGAQLLSTAWSPTTQGMGWGFLPPPGIPLLGGVSSAVTTALPVYMPSMSVGRDCFLEILFYNCAAQDWMWGSWFLGAFDGEENDAPGGNVANNNIGANAAQGASQPGGLLRVQAFSISATSRASTTDEFANRAAAGVVNEPPTVSGSFSILDTDVSGFESILYQAVQPQIAYGTVTVTGATGVPALTNKSLTWTANNADPVTGSTSAQFPMYDMEQPMRLNLILTVATPGNLRCAQMRFVVPNARVSSNSKRVQVNGVAARQYAFLCEDGNVASGATLSPQFVPSTTNFYNCGNLSVNVGTGPDSYGLMLGNSGGDTGGLAIQSFYVPAL